jgi:hypothetical protein
MPKTLKDEEGNDIEVETAEEVSARIESERQAAADEAKAEAEQEKQEALAAKEQELTEAKDQLKKFEDKEYNFSKLRNKTEKEESELKTTVKKLEETVEQLKVQPVNDLKDNFINQHIGADTELKDKFEHFYKKLSNGAQTKEETASALKESLILASQGRQPGNFIDRAIPTGGNPGFSSDAGPSQAEVEFGHALGVSEDDRKKYGKGKTKLF